MSTRSLSSATSPGKVFLDKIVAATRARIASLTSQCTFESLLDEGNAIVKRQFASALTKSPPAIIAEIKKASPSKGLLRGAFNPLSLARSYEAGGAAAFSIVTEPEYFLGNDQWIMQIRAVTGLPILRKDFVLAPIQVAEAAALGADAILLIARLLSVSQMRELSDAATRAHLDVLFEAHDEADLEMIAQCDATIIGINARNLDSFMVDTTQFETLRRRIPADVIAVAESGIDSPEQISAAVTLGYSAFLIGESLVRSDDSALLLRALRAGDGK